MAYQLPSLDYPFGALEPYIDARTMEIHLTKHHQAYITKVNEAIQGTAFENQDVETVLRHISDVPEKIRTVVQNHGGGHANHSLFWKIMGPNAGGQPAGKLLSGLDTDLGGFDKFKEMFTTAAMNRFGSGWAWLVVSGGKLAVESTANQDSPLMSGKTPLLGVDVWEHAYYLNYQNRRADYVSAFFNVINWAEVTRRYEAALAS